MIYRPNIFRHTNDYGEVWYEVFYYTSKKRRLEDMDYKAFDTLKEAKDFADQTIA
mgnify:CR=1 FL=1